MYRSILCCSITLLFTSFFCGGCGSVHAGLDRGIGHHEWETAAAYHLELEYRNFALRLKEYDAITDDNNGQKTQERNKIVCDLMWLTDYEYGVRKDDFYEGNGEFGFIGDLTTLGLTAASTITPGAPAKTVLSAVATAVVGVKTSLDANFLHNQTVSAIIAQMDSSRAAAQEKIYEGLANPDDKYSLREALIDVGAYYRAGQVDNAVVALEQNANQQKTANQTKAADAKKNLMNKGLVPQSQPANQPSN